MRKSDVDRMIERATEAIEAMNNSHKIFDLEQSILNCWNVVEDIKLLSEAVHDRPQPLTEDELSNLLIGLESLYQLKFDKMWGLFEEVCREYHWFRKEAQNVPLDPPEVVNEKV